MNKPKIMIVEDDDITSLNLNMSLQKQGYSVVAVCDNATQAINKISITNPDIIILDISLDKSNDGIELAKTIKEDHNLPFIYLTSYSDNDIITQAKETEPYGYILKPFDPNSLHATIQMALYKFSQEEQKNETSLPHLNDLNIKKLLLQKCDSDTSKVVFAQEYYLDIDQCETYYKNKKIKLTKKENTFLKLLVAQLGKTVSFEQAMDYVWQEKGASENSVRTLVWRLRNKLPSDIILNSSGIGYCIEE